jgi:ABC-type Na+ efflux pump permease subunit
MALPWIDQLGEWNPQLFREIKGCLKPRNILIAVTVSLVGQLLVLMSFVNHLPDVPVLSEEHSPIYNRYCTGTLPYPQADRLLCSLVAGNSFEINWQVWCQDVFVCLSIIGILALLVGGTYMLVNDLSKEEQRGTLNFLRLSPQSSTSILTGKLLGVPILLYLVVFLALPLHVTIGLFGQIPFNLILGFYGVVAASCLFFYSGALLFGLVGNWLSSFQAWLGSGVVLVFLFAMTKEIMNGTLSVGSYLNGWDWIALFNPSIVLTYLTEAASFRVGSIFQVHSIEQLQWFFVPAGGSVWGAVALMVLNYGLWTYWIWQGLKRCFHNPSATLLGKQQSYWMTACFEAVILGFSVNTEQGGRVVRDLFENYQLLVLFNLLLFLYLIAALSPQRQAMQDWARYRHQMRSSRHKSVLQDLIWGEKSPALVAMVLNLAIAFSMLLAWILLWPENEYKTSALWGLSLSATIILVYASVAQLILLMKTPKRAAWAAGSVGGLIVLPPIVFAVVSINPEKNPIAFLFSAVPQAGIEYAAGTSVLFAVISQSLAFGLLSIQLTRQLQKAGESSTKALLSGRSPVAIK